MVKRASEMKGTNLSLTQRSFVNPSESEWKLGFQASLYRKEAGSTASPPHHKISCALVLNGPGPFVKYGPN
ncbi:hypothetical protein TIFTF001_019390 [Ficus carica]|uniref:Uncharacterized protein n=1 Tax=Ficus carica TaxID=3494 RepID=A0AA88ABK6_FICCA|nr:hypothetical protein TIFTF001_019390 [Ficus carica]